MTNPRKSATAYELRRRSPADDLALLAMYESFEPRGAAMGLPPRASPEKWLAALSIFPNFVAIAEGRIVGHAVLCPEGDSVEVAVFVRQDFRGRGLGKALLSALIEEAHALSLRRLWGTTELENVPMLRLAHSLGFCTGSDPEVFSLDLAHPAACQRTAA